MAAPVVARSSGPALCPSFAEVCSFLERFGAVLDLPEMTFPQMERYLRDKTTGETSVVSCGGGGEAKKWLKSCDTRQPKEKGLHHHHHRDDGDEECENKTVECASR